MLRVTLRNCLWLIFSVCCVIGAALTLKFYPEAFPIVELKISMDRSNALESAQSLAKKHNWGPKKIQQTASFELDRLAQTYIELKQGGSTTFSRVLQDKFYSPYTWHVRQFSEGEQRETHLWFTPQGNFYGFYDKIPDSFPGKALSTELAKKIAENTAKNHFNTEFTFFHLVEKSQETKQNGRIDHTFTYEHPQKQLGDARYRLKMIVSGDQLTSISHFLKIPEEFLRKYGEIRSSNNTLATMSSVVMVLLYILGGCGVGIFFLIRKQAIAWKQPLIAAIIISTLQALEQINQLPLAWMHYDTALSTQEFLIQRITFLILSFFGEFILLSISFMAAEGLSRQAFLHHPQLWRVWSPKNAATFSILSRTLIGILSISILFPIVIFIYIIGTHYFRWWIPSDILFQPDSLASYFPWLTAIAHSLHAGFWEEALFRAIPLSCAALLGRQFGYQKSFILIGLLLQALIFSAAHANYPTQPSYARLIELIIPSLIFGGLFLKYGLLPGIILHFCFDVVWFALPLFTAHIKEIWIDQALVIIFSLIPLWIIVVSRYFTKKFGVLPICELNEGWYLNKKETCVEKSEKIKEQEEKNPLSNKASFIFISFTIISTLAGSIIEFSKKNYSQLDVPTLKINKKHAISIAKDHLKKSGIFLSNEWKPLAFVDHSLGIDDHFVWKVEGKEQHQKLMGEYITPPGWFVRFIQINTTVEKRAEEYQVFVAGEGKIIFTRHLLPENERRISLEEKVAKDKALSKIKEIFGIDSCLLKKISSDALQLPFRKDWVFVFLHTKIPFQKHNNESGEARINVRVAGNEITSLQKTIFVPEKWSREQRKIENILSIIRSISYLFLCSLYIFGFIIAAIRAGKKEFSKKIYVTTLILFIFFGSIMLVNHLPVQFAHFSTIEPWGNQLITTIGFSLVMMLCFSFALALLIGAFCNKKEKYLSTSFLNPLGYSIGVAFFIVIVIFSKFFKKHTPSVGSFDCIDEFFPELSCLNLLQFYILLTVLFFILNLIAKKLTKNWSQFSISFIIFCILVGLTFTGIEIENILKFSLLGVLIGALIAIVFYFLIRSCLCLIPLSTASIFLLLEIKKALYNTYEGSFLNSIIAILTLLLVSSFWHRKLLCKKQ